MRFVHLAVLAAVATLTAEPLAACCISVGPSPAATVGNVIVLDTHASADGMLVVTDALKGPVSKGHRIQVLPPMSTGNCNKVAGVEIGRRYLLIVRPELITNGGRASELSQISVNDAIVAVDEDAELYRNAVRSLHDASREEILRAFREWVTMPWRRSEAAAFIGSTDPDPRRIERFVRSLRDRSAGTAEDRTSEITAAILEIEMELLERVASVVRDFQIEFPDGRFPRSVDRRLERVVEILDEIPAADRIAEILLEDDWDAEDAIDRQFDAIEQEYDSMWDELPEPEQSDRDVS